MSKKCKIEGLLRVNVDYFLSHPFLNKLITFPYNYYDEELVDIFIAFLKSLALQINSDTIKFFYNNVKSSISDDNRRQTVFHCSLLQPSFIIIRR
jgi:protein CLEC16A